MKREITTIAKHFDLWGEPVAVVPVAAGHINDTYILTVTVRGKTSRYVLQRINQRVFEDPPKVMANIIRVTEHIHAKTSKTDPALASRQLRVIPPAGPQGCYQDSHGNFWRMYNFIENAVTYDTPESPELAREAARMFGWFQSMLTDLPGPSSARDDSGLS